MSTVLHFISGWGVPVQAWGAAVRDLHPSVRLVVHDAGDWLRRPPDPEAGAFLGGWSLGSMLAMQSALAHPGRWHGLLLVSATACFCRREGQSWGSPGRHLDRMARKLETDPDAVLGDFFALCAHPERDPANDPPAPPDIPSLQRGLAYLRDTDLRREVAALALPVALLHGRQDAVVPPEAGRWLAQCLPGAQATWIDGAGHDLPLRFPEHLLAVFRELARRAA